MSRRPWRGGTEKEGGGRTRKDLSGSVFLGRGEREAPQGIPRVQPSLECGKENPARPKRTCPRHACTASQEAATSVSNPMTTTIGRCDRPRSPSHPDSPIELVRRAGSERRW